MPDLTPNQELNRLALIAYAAQWRCNHCHGGADVRAAEPFIEGLLPYVVEHTHELGCPEHEDFGPGPQRPDRWDFENNPDGL